MHISKILHGPEYCGLNDSLQTQSPLNLTLQMLYKCRNISCLMKFKEELGL